MIVTDIERPTLKAILADLLGRPVRSLETVAGGRNSRVYRFLADDGSACVAKRYFRSAADARDRLGVEFSSITYLWDHGIRCVPRPVAADAGNGVAVYEAVDGGPVGASKVTPADIDFAVGFLERLYVLGKRSDSKSLPLASEACFSINAVIENVQARYRRLAGCSDSSAETCALRGYLDNDFRAAFDEVVSWSLSRLAAAGIPAAIEISNDERTLSPSDFGFHNAMRQADGTIIFLDFEYFGRDDPAKLIADFLLHPAMRLERELKRRFAVTATNIFQADRKLRQRTEVAYALFGLKWCLILLNEFLPDESRRRGFADAGSASANDPRMGQLEKAIRLLAELRTTYRDSPYYA